MTQRDAVKLAEKLDGAKLVKYDQAHRVAVWHGGHTVNVYTLAGEPLDVFNVGSFEEDAASREEVGKRVVEYFLNN